MQNLTDDMKTDLEDSFLSALTFLNSSALIVIVLPSHKEICLGSWELLSSIAASSKSQCFQTRRRKGEIWASRGISRDWKSFWESSSPSAHSFSWRICSSSSGVKSFGMLKSFLFSYSELLWIKFATTLQPISKRHWISSKWEAYTKHSQHSSRSSVENLNADSEHTNMISNKSSWSTV